MSNTHGGRKVKICFDSNEQGEISFEVKEIAYPHSSRSRRCSGSGEWVAWEQACFHRPAQALKELCVVLKQKQFLTPTMGKDLIIFLIEQKLVAPEDLYSLSKEPDDVFGTFFKVLVKGLYGFDMDKVEEKEIIIK